jgi:hypothetical protein
MFSPLYHKDNYRAVKTPAYAARLVPPRYPEPLYPGFKIAWFRHKPHEGFYEQCIGFVRVYPIVFVHNADTLLFWKLMSAFCLCQPPMNEAQDKRIEIPMLPVP